MQESQMSPNSNYPIQHTHRIGMDIPFLPSRVEFHKTPEQQKAIVFNNNKWTAATKKQITPNKVIKN